MILLAQTSKQQRFNVVKKELPLIPLQIRELFHFCICVCVCLFSFWYFSDTSFTFTFRSTFNHNKREKKNLIQSTNTQNNFPTFSKFNGNCALHFKNYLIRHVWNLLLIFSTKFITTKNLCKID